MRERDTGIVRIADIRYNLSLYFGVSGFVMDHYAIQIYNVFSTVTSTPISPPAETSWITLSTALLTPLIALLAVYIAWAQARTARQKLKLDLYEKRLVVYEAAKRYLTLALSSPPDKMFEVQHEYLQEVAGARWLFNEKFQIYLDLNVYELSAKLFANSLRLRAVYDDVQREALIVEQIALAKEMHEVLNDLDETFHKYLHIDH